MKNLFKLGTNFDINLIDACIELNDQYADKGQIKELFGSSRSMATSSARPNFRLPDVSKSEIETYIKKCNEANLQFNWTCNSIIPFGSKSEMMKNKQKFQDEVKWLQDIGVYRITVANPMLLEFIREVSDIELELSTIMHIDTVTQMKYYHEVYGVNKLCCGIHKNRDFKFLKALASYCNNNGITVELLANEFCGVTGIDHNGSAFATHCPYRDSCYICHATNKTKEDALAYNNYPMNRCMTARYTSDEAWLRMRWVRPQDLPIYNDIGINYFKVSGRTGSTQYLIDTVKAYITMKYDGNLINLWKPLETIYNGKDEKDYKAPVNIPCNKLDGFLDHWAKNPEFDCADVECGVTCTWCKKFMDKIKNES